MFGHVPFGRKSYDESGHFTLNLIVVHRLLIIASVFMAGWLHLVVKVVLQKDLFE